MQPEPTFSSVFVELADALTADFELSEFLHLLVHRCADLLGSDAVGVLITDPSEALAVAAASADQLETVELFQLQALEGPCYDAFLTGQQVIDADLRGARKRWPQVAPRALLAGYQSVHAFPMRLRGRRIGALNFFDSGVGRLSEADVDAAQAFADFATIGLLQQRALHDATQLNEQLQMALDRRSTIEMAKGILIERTGASPRQAFEGLRRYARARRIAVYSVATQLVESTATVDDIAGSDEWQGPGPGAANIVGPSERWSSASWMDGSADGC